MTTFQILQRTVDTTRMDDKQHRQDLSLTPPPLLESTSGDPIPSPPGHPDPASQGARGRWGNAENMGKNGGFMGFFEIMIGGLWWLWVKTIYIYIII